MADCSECDGTGKVVMPEVRRRLLPIVSYPWANG